MYVIFYQIMSFSSFKRYRIWSKYHGHCAYCGCKVSQRQMQIDHIVPDPSQNEETNLNPSCSLCNRFKSDLSIEGFREKIFTSHRYLLKYSNRYNLAHRFGLIQVTGFQDLFYFEKHQENIYPDRLSAK